MKQIQPIKRVQPHFVFCLLAMHLVWPFLFPSACMALEARELLVVANRTSADSIDLANFYMAKRGVPKENLLLISVTTEETCERAAYDRSIARPIRKRMARSTLAQRPRCIVLIKGVPLRVKGVPLTEEERREIHSLKAEQERLSGQLTVISDEAGKQHFVDELAVIEKKISTFEWNHNTGASVDSELMLVLDENHPLPVWVANPFFLGFKQLDIPTTKNDVTMVSRLDAPRVETVKRMIEEAIAVEKNGLSGIAYFDARYPDADDKKATGYARYDQSIHAAAKRIRKNGAMPVVLDDREALFQRGDCVQAALYCGWYRLAHYVDAFEWVPGAVGFHIASAECQTLRQGHSQVWCKRMLEEGVAVTIGPVDEPYVQAFPLPELFFGILTEQALTVAESYLLSVPYLSWKMVLVGDPLYRPFRMQ